jgi:hypothetical protein
VVGVMVMLLVALGAGGFNLGSSGCLLLRRSCWWGGGGRELGGQFRWISGKGTSAHHRCGELARMIWAARQTRLHDLPAGGVGAALLGFNKGGGSRFLPASR